MPCGYFSETWKKAFYVSLGSILHILYKLPFRRKGQKHSRTNTSSDILIQIVFGGQKKYTIGAKILGENIFGLSYHHNDKRDLLVRNRSYQLCFLSSIQVRESLFLYAYFNFFTNTRTIKLILKSLVDRSKLTYNKAIFVTAG